MKKQHYIVIGLLILATIIGISLSFGQTTRGKDTTFHFSATIPIIEIRDTLIVRDTIIKRDTTYVPRLVYICPADTIIKPGPVKDSLRITAFTGTFNQFITYIKANNKIGIIDKNILISESVNISGNFALVGYNRPTITIGPYLFWLREGEHVFDNININGAVITGNITLINSNLNELRLLVSGKAVAIKSGIRYVGGGGVNNKFDLTFDNTVVDAIAISNIHPDAKIYLKNKSTWKPIFNWAPPKGLIVSE